MIIKDLQLVNFLSAKNQLLANRKLTFCRQEVKMLFEQSLNNL